MISTPKFLLLSFALVGYGFAQTPPIPGLPGLPGLQGGQPPEAGGDPVPQNLTQALTTPDPNALYPSGLEFPNVDGYGMASLYQSATGKRVLVSSAAKDAQFSFIQSGGLTNRQVAQLVEKFLLMEGYQLNPDQRNPEIVSFVAVQQPGGPASTVEPIKVLTDPAQLALEEGVVAYVMKFQYLKPEEAQRAFTQIYGQFRPGGTIAEVRNASSLVITEKAALIQSLLKIKKEIDVPSAQVATAWVEITYADVQELADQLNEMFNTQANSNQSAGVQRQQAATPAIPGLPATAAAGGGGTGAGEENPPQITPDSRTNRIFLLGRPIDIVFIKELIAQWDVPSSKRNFLRRQLKYLPVYDFLPIAETAINSTLGPDAASGATGGGGGRSTAGANNRTTGANNNNTGGNNNNLGNTGGAGGSGGTASLSGSDRPTEPESMLVGNTLLVSDNVANSIIVQGPPHHIELIESLINELDVKNEQVAISAVFGRYSVTDNLSFGVNLGKILEGNGIGFVSGGLGDVIPARAISAFADIQTGANGGGSVQGSFGDFGVFVSALETYSNFHAFARPTIFTTNNKEARISSGTQIAIPTNTFTGTVNGGQSTNFEYRDVALELLVRPLVNSADEITLEISIVRDTIGEDRDVGDLDIPDLLSDQLDTIVTVPVGSAVLLGGLVDETANENKSGVPILRSIPLLGSLFRNNDDSFIRSELVIMIRPTIVGGRASLEQYQEFYDYGSNISGQARDTFSDPRYQPRRNSAVDRIFGREEKRQAAPPAPVVQQYGKGSSEVVERQPMSPIQQALYNKKRRAAASKSR